MDDLGSEDTNESGGQLRKQLERALAENKALLKKVAGHEAKQLISEKGFKYVKPEDLADVDLEEMATKAEALEQTGLEQRKELLKQVLAGQGVAEDSIDSEVDRFLNPKEDHSAVADRVAGLGKIQGGYVPPPTSNDPADLILAGIKD